MKTPAASTFSRMLDELETLYGRTSPPRVKGPLEMILLENVAYLVNDERREAAFDLLKKRVGTAPERILAAPPGILTEVSGVGGILAEKRTEKLRTIAGIALDRFKGDLAPALRLPVKKAIKELKRFPGIGDPGAEKILLFSRAQPILALDSNGLRVLVRLGFGKEKKGYASMYRSAQAAVKPQLRENCVWLIRAHLLLRRHGQELCRRSGPKCEICPLASRCAYYATHR